MQNIITAIGINVGYTQRIQKIYKGYRNIELFSKVDWNNKLKLHKNTIEKLHNLF